MEGSPLKTLSFFLVLAICFVIGYTYYKEDIYIKNRGEFYYSTIENLPIERYDLIESQDINGSSTIIPLGIKGAFFFSRSQPQVNITFNRNGSPYKISVVRDKVIPVRDIEANGKPYVTFKYVSDNIVNPNNKNEIVFGNQFYDVTLHLPKDQ